MWDVRDHRGSQHRSGDAATPHRAIQFVDVTLVSSGHDERCPGSEGQDHLENGGIEAVRRIGEHPVVGV